MERFYSGERLCFKRYLCVGRFTDNICHLLETAVICTRDSDATVINLFIAPPPNTTSSGLDIPGTYGPTPFQTTPVSYYFFAFDPHGISHERTRLEERELFERRYQTEPSSYG